jgi:hypothetical protein
MSNWESDYGLAEAAARRKRETRKIANQQAAMLGQQRGSRNLAEIQKRYSEGYQPKVASYGSRGLMGPNVQSGISLKGLGQYAARLQEDLGSETARMQQELTRIQNEEAAAQADLEDYLAQLRLQKQRDIIGQALDIKTLASY